MIALIITVIVMLILVGVTINITLKGNLFESAEKATTETEKYAILEQIIEMAVWNNGDIEVDTTEGIVATKEDVVNWNSTTGKLTIKGKKGTYDYKLSKREITIWEEKGDSEGDSILGTYYDIYVGGVSAPDSIQINRDNEIIFQVNGDVDESFPGVYTYNSELATGKFTITDIGEYSFNYVEIKENGQNVNTIIELIDKGVTGLLSKNQCTGLTPLTGFTYSQKDNDNNTIEFFTTVEDGVTYGTYKIWSDSSDKLYACYNGKVVMDETIASISSDYSTITLEDGTEYTLKQ